MNNSFRSDGSTFHTFFMDPETGAPVRGETCQGYSKDSSWARGEAWGIYGMAIAFRHTENPKCIELFEKARSYFKDHLPSDRVPYWDLIFTGGNEPRDSSSSAIVACGLLDMAKSYEKLGEGEKAKRLRKDAETLLDALVSNGYFIAPDDDEANGILRHGTYSKKSPYNTCTAEGVDESVSWGDYFFTEALMRIVGKFPLWW